MSDELLFQGRRMNRDGLTIAANYEPVTFDRLVAAIQSGQAEFVYFEPGDATRYTLFLAVVEEGDQPCLIVGRRHLGAGRYMMTAYELWDFNTTHWLDQAVASMSNGNEWTAIVLRWWLSQLCTALVAGVEA